MHFLLITSTVTLRLLSQVRSAWRPEEGRRCVSELLGTIVRFLSPSQMKVPRARARFVYDMRHGEECESVEWCGHQDECQYFAAHRLVVTGNLACEYMYVRLPIDMPASSWFRFERPHTLIHFCVEENDPSDRYCDSRSPINSGSGQIQIHSNP